MTGFDIVILIVVAISALLAFARGFVREALSMAAMFIAILAVLWGRHLFLEPMLGVIENEFLANLATISVIFILVYIAVRVATGRISDWVHDSEPLGILDRTAGLLFGVARGFVLVAVVALVITSVASTSMLPTSFREAKFYPLVMLTADGLKHLAPQAGQAATDLARGASELGENMAGQGNSLDAPPLTTPLDETPQKADEDVQKNVPFWGAPLTPEKQRETEPTP